jgi:hypothetical protein
VKQRVLAAAAALLLCAATATAQSHPDAGVFIQAGAHAASEWRAHSERTGSPVGLSLTTTDNSGTVAGGSVGIGHYLKPFLSLRAEVVVGGTLHGRSESRSPSITGGILNPAPGTVVFESVETISSTDSELRLADVHFMLGFHRAPTRRIRLSYLAGATVRQERTHNLTTTTTPGFPPFIASSEDRTSVTTTTYRTGLVVGIDAEVALTSRVAVVPHVRAVAPSGSVGLRTGVHLRLSFGD